MFTGIIEETGIVTNLISENGNKTFWITSPLAPELKPDQSVSHNGVCLTVEELKNGMHRVTAIAETLSKTNLNEWTPGTSINLERCLTLTGRLDGHIVQGHVDTVAKCIDIIDRAGSWDANVANFYSATRLYSPTSQDFVVFDAKPRNNGLHNTPEPSSTVLVGAALAGLALLRRRKPA